jgi:hypothetical protein
VISCRPSNVQELLSIVHDVRGSREFVPFQSLLLTQLGVVGGDTFLWSDDLSVSVKELARAWNTPF